MANTVTVEISVSVPIVYSVLYDIDEMRAEGVHVEYEENVERWAQERILQDLREGELDSFHIAEIDYLDAQVIDINVYDAEIAWSLLTDEEKNRVPRDEWP